MKLELQAGLDHRLAGPPAAPPSPRAFGEGRARPTGRWHLDEMAARIAGANGWLRRAVDSEGEVLVQRRRDKAADGKLGASSSSVKVGT